MDSTRIGIIGAGTMGSGIAALTAIKGNKVVLYDIEQASVARAKETTGKILSKQKEKGIVEGSPKIEPSENIVFSSDIMDLGNCELIIEAVIEDLDTKQSVFSRLESFVPVDTILATNTSSLSITAISSVCKSPERTIGIHFFNPAHIMKLVEVIPGINTSPGIIEKTKIILQALDKTVVVAKDTPGFIVNRIARPFYGEAIRLLEEGIAGIATIDWAMKEFGKFRMGPFELMDLIGNDINFMVTETIYKDTFFDPRYKPSLTQKRLVEAKYFGRKAGRGFYHYEDNASNPEPERNDKLGREIFNRIVSMLINEAADAVFMNIASVQDIDTAMTKGVNYPKGLLKWADEIGVDKVLAKVTELYIEYCEERYRPSPLLKKMVRGKKKFYDY